MPNRRNMKHNLKLAVACAILSLCASPLLHAETTPPSKNAPQTGLSSDFVYKYLVGEVAGQRGDPALAANLFLDLAKSSRDPRMAERAAKAALYGNQPRLAIQATSLWAELDPSSVEAQQAITQMLVAIGQLSDAKPYLQKLLATEATRANGFLYLNGLLGRQDDKNAVLKLVQDLAKPYPNLAEAHFTVAHFAWAAGKTDLATSELATTEKLHPGWEPAAQLQGQILFAQSPAATVTFYRKFLTQYPKASDVRLALARLLVNERRFDEARAEFVKLVQIAPNNPEIMVVVGLLSFQANDYTQAENYFQQALKQGFKDQEQVYLYLGQVAEKQKHDDQALSWYNKVQPGEHYLDAKLSIANLTLRTKGIDAAIKMLDELPDLDAEQQVLVLQAEASLLVQVKKYEEAYNLLDNAMNTLPNTPELVYDHAMAAERLQRLDVMEIELRRLIQIKPDFAQAYNALGYSLADHNMRLDEARGLIEKALTLSPNDYFILDSMGWVQYRLGKLDKAADYLRRAYTAQTDPEIAAHLGEVLWQQGKHDEAVKTWEEALREHPDNESLLNTTKKFKP